MCGILAALGLTGDPEKLRRMVLKQSKLIRHRGPDATAIWQSEASAERRTSFLSFERLQIIDVTDGGKQPFLIETPEGPIAWALNSEIYNHEEAKAQHLQGVRLVKDSKSDSAIIGHLYQKMGCVDALWDMLDGIFACVIVDERSGEFFAARDAIGVCPLYWGRAADGGFWFSSELKGLQAQCKSFDIFPPGHCYRSSTGKCERWYKPAWLQPGRVPSAPASLDAIHDALVAAVVKRLMSDAPLGVLLSGGLDSSLVASIAVRHQREARNAYDVGQRLHTFSIGIAGSPDLAAARDVAAFLGTQHHEYTFTVDEGIDALYDLIYHIESFEQVRSAVPMYLLSRKIKAEGFKVVLSGEGADEVYGGYLFFHKAPSPRHFHEETVALVERLHQFDVMRANKAPFAWGLEPRVPFLDKAFLDVSMGIDPAEKMIDMADKPDGRHPRMEKYLLRKAFDRPEEPYLPERVLWRQKEQFSDGVGYSWVDGLKAHAAKVVTDEMWAGRAARWPDQPPATREYFLLRSIFEEHFPSPSALATVPTGLSIACSTPAAIAWDPDWADTHEISGRAMRSVHDAGAGFSYERREAPLANGHAPHPSPSPKHAPGTPAAKSAPLPPPLPVAPAVQPVRT